MSTFTRRDFMKAGAAASVAASTLGISRMAHADGGNGILKIGLIGCGGRGRGAVSDALTADPNTHLVAVCDLFESNAQGTAKSFREKYGDRAPITEDGICSGFDGYKKVIEMCDVVLLCTTPHYRPIHLRAAVEAGKHVFFEKPVAVDPAGIRSVLKSGEIAKEKGLSLVCGLCWRYHKGVQETMARVLNGEIGDVLSVQETYLTGRLWARGRQKEDTEMMFQNRNWYNYTWLSGDFNTEQHVHSLDKALWVFGDQPPIAAWGVGARGVRVEQPTYGDIYDMMGVTYEYPNGRYVYAFARQINNCYNDTSDRFIGTKGTANILKHQISDLSGNKIWSFRGKSESMYLSEHRALFKSIREGSARNDSVFGARSTMLAILGRECCYTGKRITWDEIMNSKQELKPSAYTPDGVPPTMPDEQGHYKVNLPGLTPFV